MNPLVTFESLSAIAKIFGDDFKPEDSELEFDEDRLPPANIEEVIAEQTQSAREAPIQGQKENLQSNMLLVNAIKNAQTNRQKHPAKAVCNSVIVHRAAGTKTSQRKFTVKNKRESDSLIVYNDDYKDNMPSKKRGTSSRRSGKSSKHEGRVSSRKPMKKQNSKNSHKRSQSLNKSSVDQRYRSVPQNGYNYEIDPRKSYTKAKLNSIFNNRTPQVHLAKQNKGANGRLDLSLRHAKKNLQNYFREGTRPDNYNKKNFTSLTGREKGNALLRKVYLRKEAEAQNNVSFRQSVSLPMCDKFIEQKM